MSKYSKSAIVTAAGKNSRMRADLIDRNIPLENKLVMDLNGKAVIVKTLNNVLATDINECIVVLGHFKEEIKDTLSDVDDDRLKIVENKKPNVGLNSSLLNGLENTNSDICLCVAADQPGVTVETYNNLLNVLTDYKEPEKLLTVLSRIKTGCLDSAEGLGMPFACFRNNIISYLKNEDSNLNPILRKMIADGTLFYGIEEQNPLELININNYEDYLYMKNNIK